VELGAGLNSIEKLAPTRIGSPDCSAHSEALPGFVLLESYGILIIRDVFLCYKCLHRYLFKNGLQQEIMHFLWCLYNVYARHLPTDKLASNDFYFGMLGLNLLWDICQS
jgi:hypothetical protein